MKMEVDEIKMFLDEVTNSIEYHVNRAVNKEIETMVEKKLKSMVKGIYDRIDKKIVNGYLNECENIAKEFVKSSVKKGIRWEQKSIDLSKAGNTKRMDRIYEEGWHITYAGKLKAGGPEIIMLERPILNLHKKSGNSKSKKKSKGKKKVKRNPM